MAIIAGKLHTSTIGHFCLAPKITEEAATIDRNARPIIMALVEALEAMNNGHHMEIFIPDWDDGE